MKSTKTLLFAALAAGSLLAWSPARAQDSTNTPPVPPAGAPGGKHQNQGFDRIAQQLNLTDDQKTKVQPILEAQRQKMSDLRQDTSLSPEDRKAKVQEIRKDTLDQLKDILTPDQIAQFQKMSQRPHRPPPQAQGTNAPPPPQQ